jgi:hypothetical protein
LYDPPINDHTAHPHGRPSRIGPALLDQKEAIGAAMTVRIRAEIPAYGTAGPEVVADLESLAIHTAGLLGSVVAEGGGLDRDDLAEIRGRVARRVEQGIGLEPFLRSYRVAQAAYWEACSREATRQDLSREEALALGALLHEAMDTITAHAAEGYLREEARVQRRSGRATRDLVEQLIAGRPIGGRRTAAAPGLDLDAELLVAVARVEGKNRSADDLLEALRGEAEERVPSGRVRPLVALRQGELVVIAPGPAWTGGLREALEAARAAAQPRDGGLRIGLAGPAAGADGVGRVYHEALLALSYTSPTRPTLALTDLGALQSALAGADRSARQVIDAHGARFAALSEPTRATAAETVAAFAAADLNVSAAAERLGLHANTLRYRLARIAEQTGHDPRTFAGLVELVCVIEVAQGAGLKSLVES